MANGDEYKPKNLLSLLPDLAKQEIFDSMGNGYNAMDVITSAVAQSPPDHLYIGRIAAIPACQASCRVLALGPSRASRRRSSNANSLCGRNLAGSPEICATFQVPQCHVARWQRSHFSTQ